jgi:raffinose/stachyose/melibiose transport system substrate-binding protein
MNSKAAMTIDGTWALGDFDANAPEQLKSVIKIAALPAVPGGKGVQDAITGGAGWAYAVNPKVNPAKLPYLEKLLREISGPEFGKLQAETGSLTAIIPNAYTLPERFKITANFDAFQKNRPFIPVYDHQLSPASMEAMQNGLQNLFIGRVTPQNLAADIQAAYSR